MPLFIESKMPTLKWGSLARFPSNVSIASLLTVFSQLFISIMILWPSGVSASISPFPFSRVMSLKVKLLLRRFWLRISSTSFSARAPFFCGFCKAVDIKSSFSPCFSNDLVIRVSESLILVSNVLSAGTLAAISFTSVFNVPPIFSMPLLKSVLKLSTLLVIPSMPSQTLVVNSFCTFSTWSFTFFSTLFIVPVISFIFGASAFCISVFKSPVSAFTSLLTLSFTVSTWAFISFSMSETRCWIGSIWEDSVSFINFWLTSTVRVTDSFTATPSSNMLTSSSSDSLRTHSSYFAMSSVIFLECDWPSSCDSSGFKRCFFVLGSSM